MIGGISLRDTFCPICGANESARELYRANFDASAFKPAIFSARRLPDRIHYRMVECEGCGLVRANPAADGEVSVQLYKESGFEYGEEIGNLRRTYRRYLTRLDWHDVRKGALLEIGCGNGFFLTEAMAQGYVEVCGVEPSRRAVSKADLAIRPCIVCDVMRPGLFEANRFDVVCCFQVFDHVADPGTFLDECFRVLKAGGLMLCINHNINAISARLLRDRSPVVDIDHPYLYSSRTMSRLFAMHGFTVERVGAVYNRYTLRYLVHLAPLPSLLKRMLLAVVRRNPVGGFRLFLPLGNMYLIAKRP